MDIKNLDLRLVKLTYIMIAGALTLCAIISALMHMKYIALGFLLAASIVIFLGALILNFLFRIKKAIDMNESMNE